MVLPLTDHLLSSLRGQYPIEYIPDGWAAVAEAIASGRVEAFSIGGVLTSGTRGLTQAQMDLLPGLRVACCYGAGHENVETGAAKVRGIAVAHAGGANGSTVADHGMALMLALARGVPAADKAVREGKWAANRVARPAMTGKRLGVIGLGQIGGKIARRAEAFEMSIRYHALHEHADAGWKYYADVTQLAGDSDFLVAACPGGAATRHLVNSHVLEALGPGGYLINIARGTVVDTVALIAALRRGAIAGAALDVVEGEPVIPPELLEMDNVVLTPHMGGRSPEAMQAQLELWLANFDACFAGKPLVTPVGEN